MANFDVARSDLLLVEPKDLRLPEPRVTAAIAPGAEGFEVTLTTDLIAPRLMVSVEGVHAHADDCFFDLMPGFAATVHLTPESPLTVDDLRSRLRWRSLGMKEPRCPEER